MATPALLALISQVDEASAAPGPAPWLARGRSQASSSGTFTGVITYGSPDIDPHSSYITVGSAICLGVYEMLIQFKGGSTSEFAPMLAQSWEANADNTLFTFKIAPSATFHDGSPCDAAAVKASFIRFRRLQLGPYLVLARFVDNPEDQIVVADPTTVQFKMTKPQPIFLSAMASSYGPYIVSPSAVEKHKTADDPWAHQWLLANAVGTGPYQLTENDINTQTVMKKFDAYHGGWSGNHFDTVVLRVVPENTTRRQLVEQGQADMAINNVTPEDKEAMKSESGLTVIEYPTTRVDWNILNVARLSVQARQGLCFAYPYDDIINGVLKGLIKRTGPIASTVVGYDPDVFVYPTDLQKAKTLMIAGGLKEGSTIDMMIASEEEIDKSAAQLFQANLAQIGFTLSINQVDSATLNTIILGDQPAAEKPMILGSWAWFPDYNDPWNQLAPNFLKSAIGNGGGNAGAWSNDRFETLMTQAEAYTDLTQLTSLMKQGQDILVQQDPAAIFLGERQYFSVFRKEIQGYVPNPLYLDSFNFYEMSRAAAT